MQAAHVLARTDWKMLSEQKMAMLKAIDILRSWEDPAAADQLEGLLHWVDALQDAAADDGHPVVFLADDGSTPDHAYDALREVVRTKGGQA